MAYCLDPLMRKIEGIVASHHRPEGGFARWIWEDPQGVQKRQLTVSEYGAADAVNILYTLDLLPKHGDPLREELRQTLLALRQPDGSFREPTHHPLHTTAHCLAALELLDAVPQSEEPCPFLAPYRPPEGLDTLLEGLRWRTSPWNNSHQGAGVYAAMLLTGAADLTWQNRYFDWLWEHTDPVYGLGRAGFVGYRPGDRGAATEADVAVPDRNPGILPAELPDGDDLSDSAPVCQQLYGWFHYLFNMEHAKRPFRYPDRLLDTCLRLWNEHALMPHFCHEIGYMEIDWIFAVNRASRQTAHRRDEAVAALRQVGAALVADLESRDPATDDGMNDLHMLFGTVCALAELQRALPGDYVTTRPLRLVLDRRPFI